MSDFNLTPDRVYAQYRNDTKTVAWYNIVPSIGNELFTAAEAVALSYDIDNNSGVQLDIIGEIVQIGREFIGDVQLVVCEFTSSAEAIAGTASEFGDEDCVFSTTSIKEDQTASDAYYRKVLKSKISKNNGDATIDAVINAVLKLEPSGQQVKVDDSLEDMTFSLIFATQPEQSTIDLINNSDIVPRPQGVELTGYTVGF